MTDFNVDKIDFDSLVPEAITDEPVNAPLKSTMAEAVKVNPESQVEIKKLSRASGMPMEAVSTDPESVKSSLNLGKINFDEMSKRNPNTAKYLTDYNNATIAHDDSDVLTKLEDTLKIIPAAIAQATLGISESIWRTPDLIERYAGAAAQSIEDITGIPRNLDPVRGLQDIAGFISEGRIPGDIDLGLSGTTELAGMVSDATRKLTEQPEIFPEAFSRLAIKGQEADAALGEALKGDFTKITGVLTDPEAWAGFLGQAAPSLLLAYASGGSIPFISWLEAMDTAGGAAEFEEATGQKMTDAQFVQATTQSGLINAWFEKAGLDKILGSKGGGIAEIMKSTLTEGSTEAIQQFNSNFAQFIGFNRDQPLTEGLLASAMGGFGAGGVTSTAVVATGKVLNSLERKNQRNQIQQNTEQNAIDSINVESSKSKLKERDKESFREFMQEASEDSDVFIDGAQTALYLQTKSSEEIAEDPALQLLQAKADEAAALGADLTIPVADFATDITGTETYDALRDHMKLSPETSTPFRQEQEQQEAKNYVDTLINEAQESASTYVESQEIFTSVRDQLIDTGRMTPQQASVMADIVPAWATVQAQSRGIPVSQVYQESGLHIEGPLTGEAARLSEQALEQAEVPFKLGDLPRDMREELFNEHAMNLRPEATEKEFYARKVPTGTIQIKDVVVSEIPEAQLERVMEADIADLPPIVIADGRIIDGQHRVQAARAKGIDSLSYIDVTGLIDTEAGGFISELPKGVLAQVPIVPPKTFQPSEVTTQPLPETTTQLLPSKAEAGEYYKATGAELQNYLDTHGDGFLYRVANVRGIKGAGAERTDGGHPDYRHRFKDNVPQKVITLATSLDDAKSHLEKVLDIAEQSDTIIYRILPEDLSDEFAVEIPSFAPGQKRTESVYVHSPVEPNIHTSAELIYINGQFREEVLTDAGIDDSRRRLGQRRTEAGEARIAEEGVREREEELDRPRAGDIRRGRAEPVFEQAATFFSKLEDVITDKMQKKASAQDLLNMIKKGNVKAEEIKWSGIEDYLKDKKTVTKEEVIEYLQANRIEVTEVEKGGVTEDDIDAFLADEAGEGQTREEAREFLEGDEAVETKFEQYTLPGGKNYKELLLTLPVERKESFEEFKVQHRERFPTATISTAELREMYDTGLVIPSGKGLTATREAFISGHFDEPNILAHVRFNERTDAEGNKVLFLEEVQSDWALEARKKGIAEKITELPEGYRVTPKPSHGPEGFYVIDTRDEVAGAGKTEQEAIDHALSRLSLAGVPAAPFIQKNWHELALKRMLRYAAENDFDSVAWISGQQTADRYDLSNQVEEVKVFRHSDGNTYDISATKIGGGKVDIASNIDRVKLAESIGKDLAEKAMSQEPKSWSTYSDQDLKIGGEWAFTLYDKVIPNFLKKYGKKWGAKVESVELDTMTTEQLAQLEYEGPALTLGDVKHELNTNKKIIENSNFSEQTSNIIEDMEVGIPFSESVRKKGSPALAEIFGGKLKQVKRTMDQQSIPITPEMKEAVLEVGQPLFQEAKGYYDPANSMIRLTESSDLSTFLHEFAHFMYDMELKNPGSQMTEKIHNWFKRNADDVAKEANGYVGKEGAPLEFEQEEVSLEGDPDAPNYMRKYLEANGIEVNPDNTVTLYHVTTSEIAEKINKEGLFKGGTGPVGGMTGLDLKPSAFFGVSKKWVEDTWGAGRGVTLEVKVPAEFLRHGAQNFKEFYFEGGLKKQTDGTWKPEILRDTFVNKLAKKRYGAEDVLEQPSVPPTAPPDTGDITAENVVAYLDTGTSGDAAKDSAIERAVHEQFARGFETYLMEGKAPSVELRNVFRSFARWLTQIYRAVRGDLRVNLDQEMRDVFARMVATEEQINAAEARAQFEPLFTDAAMAGMTDEEFQKYQERQAKVKDKASETLRDKLIKQLTRQTEKWWKEEKSDIVDEEIERLKKEKIYIAKDTLLTGEFKLDRRVVKELVGEERTDKLGRVTIRIPDSLRNMTAAGGEGVHPDEAAGFLGYTSGDELVQALVVAPTIRKVAEENAEAEMVERHGDIMNDGTIEKEADEAVQNEERGKLILDELKALSKDTGRAVIERQMLKTMAEENIGKLSFRNIHPGKYRKAEIRAAQESAAALATGNKEEAATAKARQALNFYLGKAATEAKNDTIKIVDRMARYKKKSVREAIMKAGSGYWEQLTKVLNRFEFRKAATLTQVDKLNENINEWAKARIEEDGDALTLSPEVLDEGYVTHWKNVPYDALLGINDSVKNLEHVARYSNKITRQQEEMTFQKLVDKWVTSMNEKVTTRFKSQRTDVIEGKKWGRWAMAQMTKIPYLASWLDGQERAGLSHDILVQPFTDAYNEELKLWDKTGTPVMEAIMNRTKEDLARHNTKRFISAIKDADNDGNLFGHQILAVALNTGNESNLKKMLLGEGWANPEVEAEISFDNPKLQAVLKHMTASDWKLVQLIWDQMDQLYPDLAEVHRKTTGLTPPKVEATPIETEFGTFKGGYYPVKYDPNRSFRAEQNEDRLNAETESMFGGVGIQASVNASATNERTGYYAPIRLSLDIVPNHFQDTIHYITHHDAVRETNKLIRNESVAKTIREKLGPEEYAQLKPWLNDIAKDGRETPLKTFIGSILQRLRFGTTLGVMGFKASTGIIQILGLSNTIAEVGSGPVYQAIRSILGSTGTMQDAWDFAADNSKVLSHRVNTMDREIKNAMQKIEGKRGILAAAQEASMKHIALIQTYMVDLPSWHAAYIKGMKDWSDEKRAYAYADWVIENVQGSGVTKDMAQIMRNQSQEMRMFTMFMTFFSSLWNMERDLVKGAKAGTYSRSSVAAKMMFLFAIPVFLDMLLRGDFGDDDDDDSKLQKYLTNTALYPVQSIPFVRDAASKLVSDYGYNISPIAQILDVGLTTLPELATRPFTDEEVTKSQVKGATKFIGAATGVPGINQAWATGEHLYDVMVEGEEFTLNELLYGPRRK